MMETESPHWRYERGKELFRVGKYAEALALLDEEAQQHPESKHVAFYRGLCLASLGRMDEARLLRDRLSCMSGVTALKLAQKLTEELRIRVTDEAPAPAPRPRPPRRFQATDGREAGSRAGLLVLAGLVVLCVVAACAYLALRMTPGGLAAFGGRTGLLSPSASDEYLDVPVFCPAGTTKTFSVVIVLAPPGGETRSLDSEKQDGVGALVAANWESVREHALKGLAMCKSRREPIDGTPRNEMIQTAVAPKQGMALSGQLKNTAIETFLPTAATLPDVIAACGEPDSVELSDAAPRSVGLTGKKTYWWGLFGLAANEQDSITHLLFRAYPQVGK